ncbi:MAG: hypothetical protein R8K22_02780 [Mariprofundaceae bacterium]
MNRFVTYFAVLGFVFAGMAMPAMAANPCNPCAMKSANPCNPCAMKSANPCNPCGMKSHNPCNPCAMESHNPCNPCAMKSANPCNPCAMKSHNPCNPCGMKSANPCNPCAASGPTPIRDHAFDSFQQAATLGKKMWNDDSLGTAGLACLSCHAGYDQLNLDKSQNYPHYVKMVGDVVTLDQMINYCMINPMKGKQFDKNSKELTAMAAYFRAYRMKYLKEQRK